MKEKLSVEEIENIYYKKRFFKMSKVKSYVRDCFTKYWYLIVLLGFIFIIFGAVLFWIDSEDIFMSISITLGLGFISIGVACYSINLALDTDRKISIIMSDMVGEIDKSFEERRLNLLKNLRDIHSRLADREEPRKLRQNFRQEFSFTVWMVYRDLKRIVGFSEFVSQEYQRMTLRLTIHFFELLIASVNPFVVEFYAEGEKEKTIHKIVVLNSEHKEHLSMIISCLRDFKEFKINEGLRKTIMDLHAKLMSLK